MDVYLFPTTRSNDIIKLINTFGHTLIYNYVQDIKETDAIYYSEVKHKISMKLMPLNWKNINNHISLPNITFSGNEAFKTIYIHKFIYPGWKEWQFISKKLEGKKVFISEGQDPFTYEFIENGIRNNEIKLFDINKFNKLEIKSIKLKSLLLNR